MRADPEAVQQVAEATDNLLESLGSLAIEVGITLITTLNTFLTTRKVSAAASSPSRLSYALKMVMVLHLAITVTEVDLIIISCSMCHQTETHRISPLVAKCISWYFVHVLFCVDHNELPYLGSAAKQVTLGRATDRTVDV